MNDFTFFSPTHFLFGRGVCAHVGTELASLGFIHPLLVYGQGSVVRTGTLKRVLTSLEEAGLEVEQLAGVRPNPDLSSVHEGIALAREAEVDVVLALGGGSAMDCAKAIAVGVPYEGEVWDLYQHKAEPASALPVATVVTIPASGSEGSNSSVISNDALQMKSGITSELIRPVLSVLDPELTFSLPAYQTAAGITDMICHIMERFFTGEPRVAVTDNIACGLIRAAMEMAPRVLAEPDDYEARANIMWIGTLAHNDLAGCGLGVPGLRQGDWASHGLEHELSALNPKITHGAGLAVMFPAWMRYVWRAHPERFLEFARQVFEIEPVSSVQDGIDIDESQACEDAILAGIDALSDFFSSMGMPPRLEEFGICEADIESLIPGLRANKGEPFGCFMKLTMDDARAIYRSAL